MSGIELVGPEARGAHGARAAALDGPEAARSGEAPHPGFSGVLCEAVAQRGDSPHGRRSEGCALELDEDPTQGDTLPVTGQSLPPVLAATANVDSVDGHARPRSAGVQPASGVLPGAEVETLAPEPELQRAAPTPRAREADTAAAAQANLQQVIALGEGNKAVEAGADRAGELGAREAGPLSAPRTVAGAFGAQPLPESLDVRQPRWERGLGERLVLMVQTGVQRAELQLDPPELGALQLRVQVQHDQAQVQILSPHAAVRDVIEQQAGRLRELLASEQLQLAGFSVADSGAQSGDHRETQSNARRSVASLGPMTGLAEPAEEVSDHPVRRGLIDRYA